MYCFSTFSIILCTSNFARFLCWNNSNNCMCFWVTLLTLAKTCGEKKKKKKNPTFMIFYGYNVNIRYVKFSQCNSLHTRGCFPTIWWHCSWFQFLLGFPIFFRMTLPTLPRAFGKRSKFWKTPFWCREGFSQHFGHIEVGSKLYYFSF